MWNPCRLLNKGGAGRSFPARSIALVALVALIAGERTQAGAIRTSTPGTVVFHGGELVARWEYLNEKINGRDVRRSFVLFGSSYSPTSRTLLQAEIPVGSVLLKGRGRHAAVGNLMLWGKYRFFRQLETWGDKQASVRIGLEVPTANRLPEIEGLEPYQRSQLQLGSGKWNNHFDASFAGARGRWVYAGNLEYVVRHARNGVRLGNELIWNMDLEHIMFPLHYRAAVGEVFFLLESSFVHRDRARLQGKDVPLTGGNGFFLSPGLQYVPHRRWVVEASYQVPVWKDFGARELHLQNGLIAGVRWLY